jgi:hypothetical protein
MANTTVRDAVDRPHREQVGSTPTRPAPAKSITRKVINAVLTLIAFAALIYAICLIPLAIVFTLIALVSAH